MRRFMLGLLLGLLAAPAAAFDIPPFVSPHFAGHPLVGRIVDRAGAERTPGDLAAAARGARFLVLGETHTNPDHHRLQAALLAERAAVGDRPTLVFEMIPEGLQGAIDAYIGKGGDASGFGAAVGWEARGWPDYAIYRPIVEAALEASLPIRAGDLDRDTIRRVSREGPEALGDARAQRFGLDQPLPGDQRAALAEELADSHCGMLPETAIPAMIAVQRARDGALADAMLRAQGPAVLVAGAGHARTDRAVPARLRAALPGAAVVSVAFVEVTEGEDDASAYAPGLSDFTLFTPRFDVSDPCAAMTK